ncbi:MAG: GHKL domain-containing protein [Planctomycetes bacterium]|nr:GHKL domain-containing protein [Planctomycetota bacterium]MBL7146953.1 GHKL domain-containing protein [Phycisphaerae bacterium]
MRDRVLDKPNRCSRETLAEQILWLMRLRWIAAGGIVAAVLVGSYVFPYPLLPSPTPIYICAGILVLCNYLYFYVATKKTSYFMAKGTVLALIQVEVDLVILTAVLLFSGGVANPFFLFYIFHVIIATIILPKNLSFTVGLTSILLFGLLAINELNEGTWLGYYPLQIKNAVEGLWTNPVYVLAAFVAFVCTVVLSQYLTRIIIARMTTKEREAARNNDLLRAIIGAMTEGLIFITPDGKIAMCNPAAKLWKNKNTSQNCNLDKSGDLPDDFPPTLAEHLRGLSTCNNITTETGGGKIIKFKTDGSEQRYIEAQSSPVIGIDEQKLGHVIVGQDLTIHKKLEEDLLDRTEEVTAINEMLKMSRVEMAHREKMVAIGQMATGIAHEIGNPLASLSSVAQYLGRKLNTHEEKEHLLVIRHQVSRISNILKRMLSLSRPVTSVYKWVDINELIDNTLSLVKFDKRMQLITIKNVGANDLPMVWLNPQLLEQVLLNIFINALDAMNAMPDKKEHTLEITRQSRDETVEIHVSDTGIGMSPEVCKRAFESFFTTKEIGKGTGLGLFISYNLVTEVDGTLSMESEPGKGTTVTIRIPIRPKKDIFSGKNDEEDFTNKVESIKENNV